MSTADVILSVRQIQKSYADNHVLRGVSIDVRQGEVICILGPSGSGKSTFLRTLNHLEKIDKGCVYLDGELIGYRPSKSLDAILGGVIDYFRDAPSTAGGAETISI